MSLSAAKSVASIFTSANWRTTYRFAFIVITIFASALTSVWRSYLMTVTARSWTRRSSLQTRWSLLTASLTKNSSGSARSEEHTSELQSRGHLVCRLLLEKKKTRKKKVKDDKRNNL